MVSGVAIFAVALFDTLIGTDVTGFAEAFAFGVARTSTIEHFVQAVASNCVNKIKSCYDYTCRSVKKMAKLLKQLVFYYL